MDTASTLCAARSEHTAPVGHALSVSPRPHRRWSQCPCHRASGAPPADETMKRLHDSSSSDCADGKRAKMESAEDDMSVSESPSSKDSGIEDCVTAEDVDCADVESTAWMENNYPSVGRLASDRDDAGAGGDSPLSVSRQHATVDVDSDGFGDDDGCTTAAESGRDDDAYGVTGDLDVALPQMLAEDAPFSLLDPAADPRDLFTEDDADDDGARLVYEVSVAACLLSDDDAPLLDAGRGALMASDTAMLAERDVEEQYLRSLPQMTPSGDSVASGLVDLDQSALSDPDQEAGSTLPSLFDDVTMDADDDGVSCSAQTATESNGEAVASQQHKLIDCPSSVADEAPVVAVKSSSLRSSVPEESERVCRRRLSVVKSGRLRGSRLRSSVSEESERVCRRRHSVAKTGRLRSGRFRGSRERGPRRRHSHAESASDASRARRDSTYNLRRVCRKSSVCACCVTTTHSTTMHSTTTPTTHSTPTMHSATATNSATATRPAPATHPSPSLASTLAAEFAALHAFRGSVVDLFVHLFPRLQYPPRFCVESPAVDALMDTITTALVEKRSLPTDERRGTTTVVGFFLCKRPAACLRSLRRKTCRLLTLLLPELQLDHDFDHGGDDVDGLLRQVILSEAATL